MRACEVETVVFTSVDVSVVVRRMQQLEESGDGSGWINLAPGHPDDRIDGLPRRALLEKWLSGRGPKVPMATWTPPIVGRKPVPGAAGVEHGAGPNALDQLDEAGVPLPDGWRKLQDHAIRGIVVEPSPGAGCDEVLSWLLDACRHLCGTDIDDDWTAEIHQPPRGGPGSRLHC